MIAHSKIEELTPHAFLSRCRFNPDSTENTDQYDGIYLPQKLQRAIKKRKIEYLAGRWCARESLRQHGRDEAPESLIDERAPVWPKGFVGSITHSQDIAMALTAPAEEFLAVGIDFEYWMTPATATSVYKQILTPEELKQYEQLKEKEAIAYLTLCFSVKESLFKALNPVTGQRFYFADATVNIKQSQISLNIDLAANWQQGHSLDFRSREEQAGILTWIILPH